MLELMLDGGPLMWPILIFSIIGLAVIIDRVRAFRSAQTDSLHLRSQVIDLLYQGKLDEAIRACEGSSGPVAAVLLTGLLKYRKLIQLQRPVTEVEVVVSKTMEDYAPHVLEGLEKRMNLLPLVGSLAPLLGMTGTVTGMISSFNAMSNAAGLDAGAVAGGISEALITTAAGLLVAMPAVIAYNLFSRRIDKFMLEIDACVSELNDFISIGRA